MPAVPRWNRCPSLGSGRQRGGGAVMYSSSDGRVRALPPMWSPRQATILCSGAAVPGNVEDQDYGQILQRWGRDVPFVSTATKSLCSCAGSCSWLNLLREGEYSIGKRDAHSGVRVHSSMGSG